MAASTSATIEQDRPRPPSRRATSVPPRRRLLADVGVAALTALGALLAAAWALRLWRGDLAVPFSNQFDALLHAEIVKSVLDHGWYQVNDSLGAPFGQQLYDFPQGADNLQLLIIKALGFFSSDYAVVLNLYFLLTFPLVAVAAFVVLRRLGASAAVAGVCAVLFAMLPYHFARRELHLFLSGYYAVPLGCYLVMSTFAGVPLFARRAAGAGGRGRLPRWASRRTLGTLAMCVVIGSASVYYAGFTVILVLAAGILAFAARRDRRALTGGLAVTAAVAAMLAVNFAPSLLYHLDHGGNAAVAHRRAEEAERYALRFSQLVLPVNGHRVGALRRAKARYANSLEEPNPFNESYSAALGAVATVGFLWLVAVAFLTLVGNRRTAIDERFRHACAGAGIAFGLATVGGASTLIAYWLTPQLRSWNRLSVFIAFFSFLAVALLLDALRRRLGPRPGRTALFGVLLAAILVLGVLDQTTREDIPPYRASAAHFHSDGDFVAAIERRLPRGAAVFQVPYMGFPDSRPVNAMYIYDPVRGYLHSRRLRWSYGAMEGRPADWPLDLADKPASVALPAVAVSGFDGIWIDRDGYRDHGQGIAAAVERIVHAAPLVSRDRRLLFFDLRAYAAALRARRSPAELQDLRNATLEPALSVRWSTGFGRLRQGEGSARRLAAGRAVLQVINRRALRPGVLTTTLRARVPVTVAVRYPTGVMQEVAVSPRGTRLRRTLELRPGTSEIRFEIVERGPRPRAAVDPGLTFEDPALVEPAFVPFL
jgi:phosphoglycerol transferase